MLTISEMMNKSPLSPDEDKLLFYSAAALSVLTMVSTVLWKAYKICGGRKKYVVNHGFTEVVPVVVVEQPREADRSRPQGGTREAQPKQVGHEITQL